MTDLRDSAPTNDLTQPRARSAARTPSASRLSGVVFAIAIVVAVPLYLARGHQWFFFDDWDFLAHRSLTSAHDLFAPHNEHWSTLPIIVYRVLWSAVGLRYAPYELVVIALHLAAAILLRKIMLRSGIDAWIATAAALVFVFLGSGRQDIVWAFQIGFVGSLVFGLAHLIFADHDGPWDRRDAIGLGFGVLGLLCSGVAVTMTFIVGLAVLLRRGWRLALLHTLPLAAIYGVWFAIIGHEGYASHHPTLGELRNFVQTALANTFSHMGSLWGIGALFAIVIVAGFALALLQRPHLGLRARAAVPIALLVGALVFSLITGYGRVALGVSEPAKASRYVHLLAAMILPALAFAMDAIVRRWRVLYPVALVLLVVTIPGNIALFSPQGGDKFLRGNQDLVEAIAHSPYARRVPPSLVVDNPALTDVTAGWLADAAASGKIPKPSDPSPQLTAQATLALVLHQQPMPGTVRGCEALTHAITVPAVSGDVFVFRDAGAAAHVPLPDGTLSVPRGFRPNTAAVVHGGPVTLAFTSAAFGGVATLCRGG